MRRIVLTEESVMEKSGMGNYQCIVDNNADVVVGDNILASEVDNVIPYPYLNPLQSVFHNFYESGNALVSSSTSSGKSLVAYLFMKRYEGLKVYLAPTKSLVNEKVVEFRKLFPSVAKRTGDNIFDNYKEIKQDVLICTYDYYVLSVRNNASWINKVKCAVLDEIHQIYKKQEIEEIVITSKNKNIPILGLSATIPNLNRLAEWMAADIVIESRWRPVPLEREPVEQLSRYQASDFTQIVGNSYIESSKLLSATMIKRQEGEKVIVFVNSKAKGWRMLEEAFHLGFDVVNETVPFDKEDNIKVRKIINGERIAFHCADVPANEREEIEQEFRDGNLNILIATQTLAYGVNLPADRVIILVGRNRDNEQRPDILDIFQMEGRAGRFGLKERGYSNIFLYNINPERVNLTEITAEPRLKDLSLFGLTAVMYKQENYEDYIEETYFKNEYFSDNPDGLALEEVVETLQENEFIDEDYNLTEKGQIAISTNTSPFKLQLALEYYEENYPLYLVSAPLMKKDFNIIQQFLSNNDATATQYRFDGISIKDEYRRRYNIFIDNNSIVEVAFYLEGYLTKYKQIKNPPGEYSTLGTEVIHLARLLVTLREKGYIQCTNREILEVMHAFKYGILGQTIPLSAIRGLGHIRLNIVRQALEKLNININASFMNKDSDVAEQLKSHKSRLRDTIFDLETNLRNIKDESIAKKETDTIISILFSPKNKMLVDETLARGLGVALYGRSGLTTPKAKLMENMLVIDEVEIK